MSLKLENIWSLIQKYNFQTVTDIEKELLCSICHKLLVNAHITPCGCRFCFTCISEYLNENTKICPGNSEDCKSDLISLNNNLGVDNGINIKISKLKVKCPEKCCGFSDELRKIENHIRICNKRSIECPYSNIGCDKCGITHDSLSVHLQSEIIIHTQLLMDFVGNMNNEMNTLTTQNSELRAELSILKTEMCGLKEDCARKQEEITELQSKLDEKIKDIDELKSDIILLNNHNTSISDNVNGIISDKEKKHREIREIENKHQEQFQQLNSKCQQIENLQENANQRRENKENELMENIEKMKTTQAKNLETVTNKIDERMETVHKALSKLKIHLKKIESEEFMWKIEKFSEKLTDAKNGINTEIYSKSFLSHQNGYTVILYICPNGFSTGKGSHMSIYFCLTKGEFDDILEWPFRHSVTFALINQQTRLAHVSYTAKFESNPNSKAFIQPTDMNVGFGFHQFISLSELSSNSQLIRNDQVFIKCNVNI